MKKYKFEIQAYKEIIITAENKDDARMEVINLLERDEIAFEDITVSNGREEGI